MTKKTTKRKLIEQYEFIKEIHYNFDNIDVTIKGRIYKIIKGNPAKYKWEINYYCNTGTQLGMYIPTTRFGETKKVTESNLLKYIMRFETALSWHLNEDF